MRETLSLHRDVGVWGLDGVLDSSVNCHRRLLTTLGLALQLRANIQSHFDGMDSSGNPQQTPFHAKAHSDPHDSARKERAAIHRTRTGCQTCRSRRVKCGEQKPICFQCDKGQRNCDWAALIQRAKASRRPNSTACDACKQKKVSKCSTICRFELTLSQLKCIGDARDACQKCRDLGRECVRSHPVPVSPPASSNGVSTPVGCTSLDIGDVLKNARHIPDRTPEAIKGSQQASPGTLRPSLLGQFPPAREVRDLIDLFFQSMHHFGYFGFIHQLHFNRLLEEGKAPQELTLMMIASVMRFAGDANAENLAKADAWADAAMAALLPRVYQGFGAIQLMSLLLAQHYDLHRGNFTSAWLLSANCTRMMQMMSLQSFDRTYPAGLPASLRLSPLLTCESLRRVAWSTFYADSMVDGGRYGSHLIDEKSYRLQLPCDNTGFLSDEEVRTESLLYGFNQFSNSSHGSIPHAPLDMSAYLLRTAAARRRALHFAFRASHHERTVEQMVAELGVLDLDIETVIRDLPKRFHFNAANIFLHRDRLTTFILLHVLRRNLFIVLSRAALHIYQRDPAKSDLANQTRHKRISHALAIAGLISEGIKFDIIFDPHIGIQAYVALEILLFEPKRLSEVDPSIDPETPDLMQSIPHLLCIIRDLGLRSEVVKQLHIEAVHRLLRFGHTNFLNQTDFAAFHSEYRLIGQDPAEYDFRDFRWAKLERLRRGPRPSINGAQDEALLDYQIEGESNAPPPVNVTSGLDGLDANSTLMKAQTAQPSPGPPLSNSSNAYEIREDSFVHATGQSWGSNEPTSFGPELTLDWPWLLEDTEHSVYQTGDPVTFWSQLQS